MQELLNNYMIAIIKGDIASADIIHKALIRGIECRLDRLNEIE